MLENPDAFALRATMVAYQEAVGIDVVTPEGAVNQQLLAYLQALWMDVLGGDQGAPTEARRLRRDSLAQFGKYLHRAPTGDDVVGHLERRIQLQPGVADVIRRDVEQLGQ